MADKKEIAFDLEVKGLEQSINSVKDLKNAIKAAKDEQLKAASAFGEGSKEYIEASKNVSKLKDKVDDLNDSTQSLKGSGIERASQGFNQLGEGLRNLDFDKVKVGLTAMKSALAAVGIGLIVQAVMYLVENFDELSKGTGVLAKALQWVSGIIGGLKDALTELTYSLGLANKELDVMEANIKKYGNAVTEALNKQNTEYDRHIALLKAAGKDATWLEQRKQDNIIKTNKLLVEQMIAFVRSGGVLSEEQKKLLTASLDAIASAQNTKDVQMITAETKNTEFLKKENAKRLADKKKHLEELQAIEADAWFAAQVADEQRKEKEKQDELLAEQAELDKQAKLGANIDAQMARYTANANKEAETTQIAEEKKRAAQLETINQYTQATQQGLAAAQQITDIFFNYRLGKVKGDIAAENALKKKQFQVNKAFGITNAVIDGIGAVQKALNNPYPLNIVLAAISGIAAAANIAKIASTKFEPSGGGGGGAPSLPSAPPIPAPPSISTQQNNTSTGTQFDETGKKIGGEKKEPVIQVKATVGVDEITDKTKRVDVLEKQSTF